MLKELVECEDIFKLGLEIVEDKHTSDVSVKMVGHDEVDFLISFDLDTWTVTDVYYGNSEHYKSEHQLIVDLMADIANNLAERILE